MIDDKAYTLRSPWLISISVTRPTVLGIHRKEESIGNAPSHLHAHIGQIRVAGELCQTLQRFLEGIQHRGEVLHELQQIHVRK